MLFCSGHRIFGHSLRRDVDCTAPYCRMGFHSSDLGVRSPRFSSWLFVPLANEVTLIEWMPRASFSVTILHWLSHLLPFPTGPLWELNKTVADRCFPNCGELGQWYCFAPESWASCKYPCLPIQGRCWAGDSEKGDLLQWSLTTLAFWEGFVQLWAGCLCPCGCSRQYQPGFGEGALFPLKNHLAGLRIIPSWISSQNGLFSKAKDRIKLFTLTATISNLSPHNSVSGTTLGVKDSAVLDFIGLIFSLEHLHPKGEEPGASSWEVKGIGNILFWFCSWAGSSARGLTSTPGLFP